MKIGDEVIVRWKWDDEVHQGTLVFHSDDFLNITIKTDRGGEMNGMVGSLKPAQQEQSAVYPEAKGA